MRRSVAATATEPSWDALPDTYVLTRRCSGMRLKDENPGAVRPVAAHELHENEPSCPWCTTLIRSQSIQPGTTGWGTGEQLSRIREIMLPVAVLTVIASSALKLIH